MVYPTVSIELWSMESGSIMRPVLSVTSTSIKVESRSATTLATTPSIGFLFWSMKIRFLEEALVVREISNRQIKNIILQSFVTNFFIELIWLCELEYCMMPEFNSLWILLDKCKHHWLLLNRKLAINHLFEEFLDSIFHEKNI